MERKSSLVACSSIFEESHGMRQQSVIPAKGMLQMLGAEGVVRKGNSKVTYK